ncbi:putative toxin-antitoxin system toxin component, PIN family [Ideonella sp. A 288]|uniref:PIN domain-containing protein n=1 Tax=Ideonella sp. A 288 TaxID=1962181 RepID=UPI000B4B4567|nr:PIN domain-containing protein [Ideonella sp. A 288]
MTDKDLTLADPPEVVLDTNVVLDWLLFDDPTVRPLAEAIIAGRWRWVGTEDTLGELAVVLSRPELARWHPGRRDPGTTVADASPSAEAAESRVAVTGECVHPALATARHLCRRVAAPIVGGTQRLNCTDADDQKFIDLAMARRVQWLFSRDKAVLRLARRARAFGVTVLRPRDWPRD